jgi:heme exporter protein CcmD
MNRTAVLFDGAHALYVWGSYGLTLIAMGGEVLLLLRRRRAPKQHVSPRDQGIRV